MTLIQKFDAVLEAIYCISGQRPTFGRILAFLRKKKHDIHWAEVWDIMGKMRRDYLIHPEITDRTSKIPTEVIHLITFEGKLMYERKGLKGKIKGENITRVRIGFLEWTALFLALGTLYFAIGGVNDSTLKQTNELLKKSIPPQQNTSQPVPPFEGNNKSQSKIYYDSVAKKYFYLDTFYIGVDTIYK